MFDQRPTTPDCRWISVAFLQGQEAEDVLGLITRRGAPVARQYLQQRDYGAQTTEAALTNGYVYDRIPAGSTDSTLEDASSPYALTYSTQFRYVSLLRRYPVAAGWEPAPAPAAQPTIQAPQRANIWAPLPDRSTTMTKDTIAL